MAVPPRKARSAGPSSSQANLKPWSVETPSSSLRWTRAREGAPPLAGARGTPRWSTTWSSGRAAGGKEARRPRKGSQALSWGSASPSSRGRRRKTRSASGLQEMPRSWHTAPNTLSKGESASSAASAARQPSEYPMGGGVDSEDQGAPAGAAELRVEENPQRVLHHEAPERAALGALDEAGAPPEAPRTDAVSGDLAAPLLATDIRHQAAGGGRGTYRSQLGFDELPADYVEPLVVVALDPHEAEGEEGIGFQEDAVDAHDARGRDTWRVGHVEAREQSVGGRRLGSRGEALGHQALGTLDELGPESDRARAAVVLGEVHRAAGLERRGGQAQAQGGVCQLERQRLQTSGEGAERPELELANRIRCFRGGGAEEPCLFRLGEGAAGRSERSPEGS